MNLDEMIDKLKRFSTSLNTASDRQQAFFQAFSQAHVSLQNPQAQDQAQAQADAVTALHTQVQNILGNQQNQQLEVVETTEALLHLASLASQNTMSGLTFGDIGALNVAHTNILRKRNLSELFQIYFQDPQKQAIEFFNSIIRNLQENQPAIQQGLILAGQVVNTVQPAQAQAQDYCAAAAPTTPRGPSAVAPTTPPGAPVQVAQVDLPNLPQSVQNALRRLQPQFPPMPGLAPNGAGAQPAYGRENGANH